jgi:hypothetical protein
MRDSKINRFQATIAPRLSRLHGGAETRTEWAAMSGLRFYSPRLDIAVGPFATGNLRFGDKFDELLRRHGHFVRHLCELSDQNVDAFAEQGPKFPFERVTHHNWNARCLLAIEIENEVSRKHLMGGAINAAALGRVGIAVGWTSDKVRAFVKLRTYLLYLGSVGKNTFQPINLLVLSAEQLADAVDKFDPARKRLRARAKATSNLGQG